MATPVNSQKQVARRRRLLAQRGSQLMEMALALPFLLVFAVGLSDFGGAYNLKQKLSSAAREGARFGISESTLDLSDNPPASVVAIRNTVANHMTNAGLTGCAFATTAPVSAGAMTWTVTPKANCVIKIERNNTTVASGGLTLKSTQVTVTYPLTWTFNKIIGLLKPGANPTLPASLSSAAFMENIP